MRKLRVGPGFTVFVLFFGLSLIEAIEQHNWWMAGLFLVLGLLFLRFEPGKKSSAQR